MGHKPYPESQYEERPFHAGSRFPQQEPSLLAIRAAHPLAGNRTAHDSGEHPEKGGSIGRRRSKFHRHAERHVRQAEDAPCHAGHQDKRRFRQIRRAALRHRQSKRRLFRPDRPHAEYPLLPEPENLPVQRRRHRHIGRYESGQPAHRPGHHLSYPLYRRPEYAGADFPSSGRHRHGWKDECRPETALPPVHPQETGLGTGKGSRQNQDGQTRATPYPKEFRVHKQRYAGLCRQRMARRAC